MDKKAVAKCLSKAIVDVAGDEYSRLSAGMEDLQVAQKLHGALESLAKLQSGKMPQYDDEWVALLYMTWYHPNRVNLAYSMIEAALAKRERLQGNGLINPTLTNTGRLRVVDFGCGTLAMQFGVALAVADALERGQTIHSVKMDSVDANQPMTKLGEKLWNRFVGGVSREPNLSILSNVLQRVMDTNIGESTFDPACDEHDRWLSALHIVYKGNLQAIKDGLAKYTEFLRPDLGFITSHSTSVGLAKDVSPFVPVQYTAITMDDNAVPKQIPYYYSYIDEVKRWRQSIKPQAFSQISGCFPLSYFLNGPVDWRWQPAHFRIYTRNE